MRVSMETLARLNMREGLKVEVCYEENDVWYKGTIETTRPPTKSKAIRHFSVRLVKNDFATPLTQTVLIRPVPPKHVEASIDIKEGSVVDAYHKEGWWTGFVIKEMEDNNCLVFFDSPPDIIQFDRKDLRPRLNWRLNKKRWSVPHPKTQLLRRLTEESKFSSGTMVEVSSEIAKKELVWFPAMIIKEIEEDDESKYIVKFCNKPLNVTVDSKCVRPKPPPVLVHEFNLLDSVEAFRNSRWRNGIVKRIISQKCYMVSFESTKKQVKFDHSDLRFPMEWEDGVWKTSMMNGDNNPSLANESVSPVTSTPVIISTPLKHTEAETQGHTFPNKTLEPMTSQNCLGNDSTQDKGNPEKKTPSGGKRHNSVTLETRNVQTKEPQGSGNKMADALLNVKQEPTQGNTSNETTLTKGNESTRDKMPEEPNSEDNSRKRKRGELEHNSDRNETVQSSDRTPNMVMNVAATDDEGTKAKDATMVLPFVKKSPVWKTYESMEVFKRVPQSPHFSPLFETKEDFREGFALGMMVTFSGVLEKVKDLKAEVPISQLNSLKDSFTELEKHGFTVTAPISRINKLLALKDRQLNILNELKGFEEEMTDGSSKKRKAEQEIRETEGKIVEVKHKILELQRQGAALEKHKDATYKKISLMESRARDLGIELEDVEFEFETLLSAPW